MAAVVVVITHDSAAERHNCMKDKQIVLIVTRINRSYSL